jgi:hypothetical protein
MGELKAPSEFGARYHFEDARFVDELQQCVQAALLLAGEKPQFADARRCSSRFLHFSHAVM